jgi:hypothetical protein
LGDLEFSLFVMMPPKISMNIKQLPLSRAFCHQKIQSKLNDGPSGLCNLADLTTNRNASICGYVTKGTQGK